jgi:O-antigen/teichoic acid export membrane protein
MADPTGTAPADAAGASDEDRRTLGGLVRHSAIYGLVPIVHRGAAFLMIPFYWALLRPAQWGLIGLGDLLLTGLSQLLGVNLASAMARFYFDHDGERERRAVISSTTIVLTAIAWIVCGIAMTYRHELAPVLLGDYRVSDVGVSSSEFLVLVLMIVPFRLSTFAGLSYLQIRQRSAAYSTIQLTKVLLELGLRIWFIAGLGWGVRGFMLSTLVGEVLGSLFVTGWVLWRVGLRVDLRILKPMLVYAAPLVPMGMCQVALHQLDKRLIPVFDPQGGQAAVGLYHAGYQLGMIVNMLVLTPFMQTWHPWIFGVKDERVRAEHVAKVTTWAVTLIAGATVALVLMGRPLVDLFTLFDRSSEFAPAFRVIPWVAAGYVFWALYHSSQLPLFIAKRTMPLFWINAVAVGANVLLNATLVTNLGWEGAGLATLGTFALLAWLGMEASRDFAHVPFETPRILIALAVVMVAACLAWGIDNLVEPTSMVAWVGLLGVKLVLLALGTLALWRLVLTGGERQRLLGWSGGRLRGPVGRRLAALASRSGGS